MLVEGSDIFLMWRHMGRYLFGALAGLVALMLWQVVQPIPGAAVGRARPVPLVWGVTGQRVHLGASSTLAVGMAYGDTLPAMSSTKQATAIGDATTLGMGWVRLDVSWADIQPDDAGHFSWAALDQVVHQARNANLDIVATLAYTPGWARPAGCSREQCQPEDNATFATFARAAVNRYASRGIHTWELWNEENTAGFWAPTPNAARYADLAKRTAAAIHAADSSAKVLIGGLAASLTTKSSIDTRDFLVSLCAQGVNHYVEGVAYHPYTYPYLASFVASWGGTAWNKIAETPRSLRSILSQYGTPNLGIWLTEYGAPSVAAGHTIPNGYVSETRQASIAADAIRTARVTPGVAAIFWYTNQDLSYYTGPEAAYGLRRVNGTKKPAFAALQQAIRSNN